MYSKQHEQQQRDDLIAAVRLLLETKCNEHEIRTLMDLPAFKAFRERQSTIKWNDPMTPDMIVHFRDNLMLWLRSL